MKFLPLLWSSLWRKKIRTIFTLLRCSSRSCCSDC